MKAFVLSDYKRLELLEMKDPQPGPGDLLIAVRDCGICGSDVHGYDGSTGRRRPPLIMGHEAAGVVQALGDGVDGFAVGDRVTFDSTVYCGRCYFCARGLVDLCDHRKVIGVSTNQFRRMGAFAEYVTVPARIAYHFPAEMPFHHAALIEAASVAAHGLFPSSVGKDLPGPLLVHLHQRQVLQHGGGDQRQHQSADLAGILVEGSGKQTTLPTFRRPRLRRRVN